MMDDQWQAQVLIVKKVDGFVRAEGLRSAQITQTKLAPCPSIEEKLSILLRKTGRRPGSASSPTARKRCLRGGRCREGRGVLAGAKVEYAVVDVARCATHQTQDT